MLAFKEDNKWVEWTGEPRYLPAAGGYYRLPSNVESILPDPLLAEYGLYRVTEFPVIGGGRVVSYKLEDRNGRPEKVDVVEAIPVPVTTSVSRRQLMLGFYIWGLDDKVTNFVAGQDRLVQLSWEATFQFNINDPMVIGCAAALGKSDILQEFFDFCATL